MFNYAGKTALITGASSGIGRAIAAHDDDHVRARAFHHVDRIVHRGVGDIGFAAGQHLPQDIRVIGVFLLQLNAMPGEIAILLGHHDGQRRK